MRLWIDSIDNDVCDLVDTRKLHVRNLVSRRWVLTLKRDKDGKFLKRKASEDLKTSRNSNGKRIHQQRLDQVYSVV